MKGRIKTIHRDHGYAFIKSEIGQDVFMHSSVLDRAAFSNLREGTRVVFDFTDTPRGLRATIVTLDV
jgi:cold shock CspA family protein